MRNPRDTNTIRRIGFGVVLQIAGAFFFWLNSTAISAQDVTPNAPIATPNSSKSNAPPKQTGKASWYGAEKKGKKTADGERFNPNDLTAAHRTLPLGSKAVVTNPETGKSTEVRINDRGPYRKGRKIDLSRAAAEKIGAKKKGVTMVTIKPKTTPKSGEPKAPEQQHDQ